MARAEARPRRFELDGGRELTVGPWGGTDLLVIEVHAAGGCCVGSLAIRPGDIPTIAAAIEVLRIGTAIEGGQR